MLHNNHNGSHNFLHSFNLSLKNSPNCRPARGSDIDAIIINVNAVYLVVAKPLYNLPNSHGPWQSTPVTQKAARKRGGFGCGI